MPIPLMYSYGERPADLPSFGASNWSWDVFLIFSAEQGKPSERKFTKVG